jgi:hypothetical protein
MEICTREEMEQYIINCGSEKTGDVFIINTNVYWRLLDTKQYVTKHPFDVIVHKTVTSNVYFCWNYQTHNRRYIDFDTFQTQLKVFKFINEDECAHSDLIEEILNNDLTSIAIISELMF